MRHSETRFWFWFVVVAALHISALRLLPRSAPSSLDNAMPELTFVLVDESPLQTTQPLVRETSQTRELRSNFHSSVASIASRRIDDSSQLSQAPSVEGAPGIRRVDGGYDGVVVVEPSAIGLSGSSSYRMTTARTPLPVESESARAAATLNQAISDVFYDPEANGALTHGVEDAMRRLDGAPYEGRAILAVRVDDVGRIVAVQVDDCATDRSAWQELATAVLNSLAERRLHVAHGAHGMELRVEVIAKVAFASGASSPLDVGLGGATFDLSDVGSHRQRRVTARVVAHRAY